MNQNFLEDQRQEAQARFEAMPLPVRTDETWRFSSIKKTDFEGFTRNSTPPEDADAIIAKSRQISEVAARFVFVNDTLVFSDGNLPEKAVVLPFDQAVKNHPELVKKYFMRQETKLGSAKFAELHRANVCSGLFVFLPEGVEIEKPIEVYHWTQGAQNLVFPHTLIVAESHAKVCVVDYFQSADDQPAVLIAVNDLVSSEGSQLKYCSIQNLNETSRLVQINATLVGTHADVKSLLINTGASWARQETLCKLAGEHANSDMLSISVPAAHQEYDQRTFQHHSSPSATSDLLYKNTLFDQARTVFSGLIFVDHGAHMTDAYQKCRNLLMSDEAEANSLPGLEINADQVKCSHGSTSAPIDEEEVFYLCARGIRPQAAQQLIARGFSNDVLEKFDHTVVAEIAMEFLDAKFAKI